MVNVVPLPMPSLSDGDLSAVQRHEVPHDGQAEAEAGLLAHGAVVELAETLEDVRQKLGTDALPGVGDAKDRFAFGTVQRNAHASALGREFDRVRKQIPDDLVQPRFVAVDAERPLLDVAFRS